jgi:hypothetical protein
LKWQYYCIYCQTSRVSKLIPLDRFKKREYIQLAGKNDGSSLSHPFSHIYKSIFSLFLGFSVPDLTNSGSVYGPGYGYRAGSELLDGKNSTVQTGLCIKVAKYVAYQILTHS